MWHYTPLVYTTYPRNLDCNCDEYYMCSSEFNRSAAEDENEVARLPLLNCEGSVG